MHLWRTILCTAVIGGLGLTASAQNSNQNQPGNAPPAGERPRGGGQGQGMGRPSALSPEKSKAAWEMQATSVSKQLGLDADKTKAVVKAYTEAREGQTAAYNKLRDEAMQKLRDGGAPGGEGGANGGRMAEMNKAFEDLNTQERGKLEKSLTAAGLTSDQTTKAVASLGTFNRSWDVLVDTVSGFGLEAAKQQEAFKAIEHFVVASGQASTADLEARRTAMTEARTKLMDSLKPILNDEQLSKVESAFGPGGRGGRGGGPGGGGRGGDGERPRGGGGNGGGGGF